MKVPNGWTLKALSSQKLELTPRNQPINTTTNHMLSSSLYIYTKNATTYATSPHINNLFLRERPLLIR